MLTVKALLKRQNRQTLSSSAFQLQSQRGFVFGDKKDSFLYKHEKQSTHLNPKSPAMIRKKEILKEVYERCGEKA